MRSGSALPPDVLPPGVHHGPALVEQVRPPIGAFDALDHMGQRGLRQHRRVPLLSAPVAERRPEPVNRRPLAHARPPLIQAASARRMPQEWPRRHGVLTVLRLSDDIATIIYTSGTTRNPKGRCSPRRT